MSLSARIRIFLVGSVKLFSATMHFDCSEASKVIDFGTNRKCVYDFLLVRPLPRSKLTLILYCTVSEILQIFDMYVIMTHLFHPNFGVFPLDQITYVGVSPSRNLKRISSLSIPTCVKKTYMNVTDGRTDGRTDDLPWHINRALRSIAR